MTTNFRYQIGENLPQSATRLPSFAFHNGWKDGKADGRINIPWCPLYIA